MSVEIADIDTQIDIYESKRLTYDKFAKAIESILKQLLSQNNIRFQNTESREKDTERLRKKLLLPQNLGKKYTEIPDLAGSRVILHIERDIAKLAQIVHKEFDVVHDEEKISEDGYNARHLDIRLKPNRTELTEYRDCAGLTCEIQLTTTLFHAWSSLYHDDMYKDLESLKSFDEHAFNRIDGRFKKVMKYHISEASNEFTYLMDEVERMRRSKVVLSPEFVQRQLLGSETLNALFSSLNLYKDAIVHFGDKEAAGRRAVEIIQDIIRRASELRDVQDTDSFWNATEQQVVLLALETLEPLRYHYCEDVIGVCINYAVHPDESVKKQAEKILARIVRYELPALKKIGYYPQKAVIDALESLDDTQLAERPDLVRQCCEAILEPTFEDSRKSSWNTFEFGHGALHAGKDLRTVRSRAVELLKRLYTLHESLSEKRITLRSLMDATQTPVNVNYPPELQDLVLHDVNKLCDWFKTLIAGESFILRADIHDQIHWLRHRFGGELGSVLTQLEETLKADSDYGVFRNLVGYDHEREPHRDYQSKEEDRLKAIAGYVDDMTGSRLSYWEELIRRIAAMESAAPHEYEYFYRLVGQIGERRPDFAVALVEAAHPEMDPFLPRLMEGLLKSSRHDFVPQICRRWVGARARLGTVAHLLIIMTVLDEDLFNTTATAATETNDVDAMQRCIIAVFEHHDQFSKTRAQFITILRRFTECGHFRWPEYVWRGTSEVAKLVTGEEAGVLLASLVLVPRLEVHVDRLIGVLAERFPEAMIRFFRARVGVKKQEPHFSHYDAVPFSFHHIAEHFQQRWTDYLPLVMSWHKSEDRPSWSHAATFVSACFPVWNETLERSLIRVMDENDPLAPSFVIDVLHQLEPTRAVQAVAVEYLKRFGMDAEARGRLADALRRTGVVGGEFGFSDAYKSKKEWVEKWPRSDEPGVREFMAEMTTELDAAAKHARKRETEELHRRKADFE
jgi:ppGpp synthetase/RelA/SpoT-type nucleotidyltranferase